MLGGGITNVRLIQVGNNRNDYFRYFLGVHVRLIEVSINKGFIKVNTGNIFGDSSDRPRYGGCPLNTGFTVGLTDG